MRVWHGERQLASKKYGVLSTRDDALSRVLSDGISVSWVRVSDVVSKAEGKLSDPDEHADKLQAVDLLVAKWAQEDKIVVPVRFVWSPHTSNY